MFVFFLQVKKYDSKAAVVGTPKAYSTGEDMVAVKTVSGATPAIFFFYYYFFILRRIFDAFLFSVEFHF